jgi:hypothetical protein
VGKSLVSGYQTTGRLPQFVRIVTIQGRKGPHSNVALPNDTQKSELLLAGDLAFPWLEVCSGASDAVNVYSVVDAVQAHRYRFGRWFYP